MLDLVGIPENRLAVLSLARVELPSAVRRRERAGDVLADEAVDILARFTQHVTDIYLQQPVTDAVIETAVGLIDSHALRALDALQLAGCISMGVAQSVTPTFVCADVDLVQAAVACGLPVLLPDQ